METIEESLKRIQNKKLFLLRIIPYTNALANELNKETPNEERISLLRYNIEEIKRTSI
jgi:DNA-directed RNA polymerase subunit L